MDSKKQRDQKALKEEQEMRKMTRMLMNMGMAEMVVDLDLLKDPPADPKAEEKK